MKIGDIIRCSDSRDMLIKAEQLTKQGVHTIFKENNILEVVRVAE